MPLKILGEKVCPINDLAQLVVYREKSEIGRPTSCHQVKSFLDEFKLKYGSQNF